MKTRTGNLTEECSAENRDRCRFNSGSVHRAGSLICGGTALDFGSRSLGKCPEALRLMWVRIPSGP